MGKSLYLLTPKQLDAAPAKTALNDGGGLLFRSGGGGTGKWVFKFTSADPAYIARQMERGSVGRQREMGLGAYPATSLSTARKKADAARALVDQKIDPIEDDARQRALATERELAAQRDAMTFRDATEEYLAAKMQEHRNAKHRDQWRSTLLTYAIPFLGAMKVQDITIHDVLRVLTQPLEEPGETLWVNKTETATRLRGRIEAVLSWATVSGHRTGENPARWKGNLKELLPAPQKIAKKRNQPAVQITDLPRWFAALRLLGGMGSRALEFACLTATRSQEVRGARWDEIDLERAIWTIPASRMKMNRKHLVPLSPAAVALLEALPRTKGQPLVFPAIRGGMLSDMTLSATMRRMHEADIEKGGPGYLDAEPDDDGVQPRAVPHGLRSTFRDWVADRTYFPGDMAETALAHRVSKEVEAAYRRGHMVDKRRQMMTAWANFCAGLAPEAMDDDDTNVVPMRFASEKGGKS